MELFKPTELHAFLQSVGKRASKRLSQNFLIDGNILRKIVQASDVKEGDIVVEIGPGPGALTQALLKAGAHVIAIEKDRVFAESLKRLQTEDNRLQVFEADVLEFPLETILTSKVKVVANLPYQITTPILAKLIPLYSYIESITVMVQREVALRFIAKKGTADYSSFTLFLKYYSEPSYCFTVEPTCFFPRPQVRSAVVHLALKKSEPGDPGLFAFIRSAFQKRRKMLRSTLKEIYPLEKIETGLQKLGVSLQARPEELSLEDFSSLFASLRQ